MQRFHVYSSTTSWVRVLIWCTITPIPCLLANVLLDFAPLAKPSAGREANYVFWVRGSVVTFVITYVILMQVGFLAPGLGMTHRYVSWITLTVTVGCMSYNYVLDGIISMPIPFQFLAATPIFSTAFIVMFAIFFGQKLKNDSMVRVSSIRAIGVISIQLTLTFIYPIFIYGFNSIPANYQTPHMIFVPVIKITAKNIMSKLIDFNDIKPETLVFCVDTFHAVYITLAMQNATTLSTSLFVMLIDFAQACVSVYDVYQEFQPLKRFMERLPATYPLHGKTLLEVAVSLDQEGRLSNLDDLRSQQDNYVSVSRIPAQIANKLTGAVQVAPLCALANHDSPTIDALYELGSQKGRQYFLFRTRKLLFTTEFVILIEYSEVIIPTFYGLFTATAYFLPNRAFYLTIRDIDENEIWPVVTSVLMYAGLELLSLVAMEFVLRGIMGVSSMRQVGFVLGTQCVMAQSKLLSWVLYGVQNLLEHAGADFTFQFKWLLSRDGDSS